jgi:phosphoribosylformylglycinamidine (FGAM) synthase-like enzyme
LIESGFNNNLGFSVSAKTNLRKDAYWFGEAQGRVVVSCTKENAERLTQNAKSANIEILQLGTVTAGNIEVNGGNWGSISDWKNKYDTAIEKLLN